ncbi:hypothetical protein BX600DRAFT_513483 [Xylariales sp. PMI_506]|nr:hypothetical protein BX600DRAFT_513483 [Xylariales sp. PMI_506]
MSQRDETDTAVLVPPSTWDTHIHVIDMAKFPLAADASYTPSRNYTLLDARIMDGSLGIGHTVLIQPSIYDEDNAGLLAALEALGTDYARGIVVYDPNNTTACTLREWDSIGVRGVRINQAITTNALDEAGLNQTIHAYLDSFRSAGVDWILDFAIDMAKVPWLESILSPLDVRVVFDHFAYPDIPTNGTVISDPYSIDGFSSLVNLVRQGNTFVKFSAPYLFTDTWSDLDPIGQELLRVGPKRMVWASNWPHVPNDEGTDISPFISQVMGWCGDDEKLLRRVFLENAKSVFDAW